MAKKVTSKESAKKAKNKKVVKKPQKEDVTAEDFKNEVPALVVAGVDVNPELSVSEGVHDAIKTAKEEKTKARGEATSKVSVNGGSENPNQKVVVATKIKSRHQLRTENFFKEQERKKKLAAEKAAKK